MRLLKLKLLTEFRGLPADSEYAFDNVEPIEGRLEPICLVGLNGSGKSNLLEVLSEIFYFLEIFVLKEGISTGGFATYFGFDITYELDLLYQAASDNRLREMMQKNAWEYRDVLINIRKAPLQLPIVTIDSGNKNLVYQSKSHNYFILPRHVIAYSSGQNELLSNPFIKLGYYYFDELGTKQSKNENLELSLSRLFHLDYGNSQLITICNYLFSPANQVQLISDALKLEDLDSFDIVIRFRNYRNNPIEFAALLTKTIQDLKSCATAIEEVDGSANFKELKLSYKVDAEMKRAFQKKFGSAINLFRSFYYLQLMNIHSHGVDTRNRIKKAGMNDNLASIVPVPPREKLVFILEGVNFKKTGKKEPIKYKNLSDGEHQLMHVLGSIMLLNTSGSLLLYDEPETHFNPEWRSQLISLINKASVETAEEDEGILRKQEILITSHSPFIVSDCRQERVFIFDKGKAETPKINTFGTSVDIIMEEVFKKKESISQVPIDKINELREKLKISTEVQSIKEEARELGESAEKVLLFRELILKEEELKNREDDKDL